jgi:hypothetical protein
MSAPDLLAIARRIVDGPYQHAAAAREACRSGRWAELAQRTAPERPGLFGGRGDWAACIELASRTFSGPKPVTVTIVPAWGCSTDEGASTEWVEIHAVVVDAREPYIAEAGPWYEPAEPQLRSVVVARANAFDVAWVVPTRSYAPSIELMLRRGKYGVLAARVIDLLDLTEGGYREGASPSDAVPRPTIEVPPFCQWTEPRASCSASLAAAIRKLSVTTDDEGKLVERPAM